MIYNHQCQCGRLYSYRCVLPIHCSCGVTITLNGYEGKSNITPEIAERLMICKSCDNKITAACKIIDAGCSKTFKQRLHNLGKSCPKNLWSISVDPI